MTRLIVVPAALAAVILLASSAFAKVPDPRFSSTDRLIVGNPDGTHAFQVNLRDVSNAPLWYEEATLDFSGTSVRLYAAQEPGVTVDCAARTLMKVSDQTGTVVFHPRFGGSCNPNAVVVSSRGVHLAMVPARSTDVDGLDGSTGMNDFAVFARAMLEQSTAHPELDFDGSGGAPGLADFVLFSKDLLSGAKGAYCP
jgi:hypothetical protein